MTAKAKTIDGLVCGYCGSPLKPRKEYNVPENVYCSSFCRSKHFGEAKIVVINLLSLAWHAPLYVCRCKHCGERYYRNRPHFCRESDPSQSSQWSVVHRCAVCSSPVYAPHHDFGSIRGRKDAYRFVSRNNWVWGCNHREYYEAVRKDPMGTPWPEE